jgi:hypothetical protein
MSPRYRRAYNTAPTAVRLTLITLSDLWAALAFGTRWDRR